MTNKVIKETSYIDMTDAASLKEWKQVLETLIKEYGENAILYIDSGYDGHQFKMDFFRPMTEQEQLKLEKKEQRKREKKKIENIKKKEKEYKQYLRLKAKYAKN